MKYDNGLRNIESNFVGCGIHKNTGNYQDWNDMFELKKYPKVVKSQALSGKRLLVMFDNGETKVYDCSPLLEERTFFLLKEEAIFKNVKTDPYGYGVVWNEDLDLSESELWINGKITEPADELDSTK